MFKKNTNSPTSPPYKQIIKNFVVVYFVLLGLVYVGISMFRFKIGIEPILGIFFILPVVAAPLFLLLALISIVFYYGSSILQNDYWTQKLTADFRTDKNKFDWKEFFKFCLLMTVVCLIIGSGVCLSNLAMMSGDYRSAPRHNLFGI